jgi:hypothetical protein
MEKPSLDTAKAGAMRFNTDGSQLEIYDGNQWTGILGTSPNQQTGGTRGLTAGAYPNGNQIDFFNIDTTGNSVDFGDRTISAQQPGSAASRTRGCVAGGYASSDSNVIDFVTMASQGNASNFGDLTQTGHGISMCINDSTRGVFAGRTSAPTFRTTIDYITIASTGDAADFGDVSIAIRNPVGGSSPTRGVFALGRNTSGTDLNSIDFLTISTQGNTSDFGDLQFTGKYGAGGSNAVRCLMTKGDGNVNTVNFVTIATLGDAQDFGDLTQTTNTQLAVMCTSPTRAVRVAGQDSYTNTMDYAQIMTTGNFIDFGDAVEAKSGRASLSNGHGGL